jgi:hypothetical protein
MGDIEYWKWTENKAEQAQKSEMRCLSLCTPKGVLCRYWGNGNPPEAADIANLPTIKSQLAEVTRERDELKDINLVADNRLDYIQQLESELVALHAKCQLIWRQAENGLPIELPEEE